MVHTDFIIQARLNSSRLPGKAALILNNGNSVVQTLVDRLQKYITTRKLKSRIFVACPESEEVFFKTLLEKNSCILVCGSELNVAKRFHKVIKEYSINQFFLRITADSPYMCFDVIDYVMNAKIDDTFLCLSTYHQKLLPEGTIVSKLHPNFINKIIKSNCNLAKEHLVLTNDKYLSSLIDIPEIPKNLIWPEGRFCIDYLSDYFYLLPQQGLEKLSTVREYKSKLKARL
ncbi:hypothetical protein OA531_02035 [Candidatus Pelagibacter sp.]|nr:hypothetical protein [Candidatus Pelagibacter sp.]